MTNLLNKLSEEDIYNIANELIENNIKTRSISKGKTQLSEYGKIIQKYTKNKDGNQYSTNTLLKNLVRKEKQKLENAINSAIDKIKNENDNENDNENETITKKKVLTATAYNKNLANEIVNKAKNIENNESDIETVSLKPSIEEEEAISKPIQNLSKTVPSKIVLTTPAKAIEIKDKIKDNIKSLPNEKEIIKTLYDLHYYNKPDNEIIDYINKQYNEDEKKRIFNDKPLEIVVKLFKEYSLNENLQKLNKYSNLSDEQIQTMKQEGLIDDSIENEINNAKKYVYERNRLNNLKNDYLRNPAYNNIKKTKIISLLNNGFNPALLKHP